MMTAARAQDLGTVATMDAGLTVEGALLARYAAGDSQALDELVTTWQKPAFWVARHLVFNDEVALDIVHDAFVRLLRRYESYDGRRAFRSWFLQIVRNLAIDHLRRSRPELRPEFIDASPAAPVAESIDRAELPARVQCCLAELPERYRELLIWREIEGMSPQEIAEITQADPGTTRWRIHHARKLFRDVWLRRFGEEALP